MNIRTKIKILLIIIQFLIQTFVSAQPLKPRFENLTIKNGLINNSISHIFQDKRGFLWISTRNGLNRYDGRVFKTTNTCPGD